VANGSRAMGPMPFKARTWAAYGIDGNGDGKKDVYDPADAIPVPLTR
jgi:membrane-bound lytic murein transglycosylase B